MAQLRNPAGSGLQLGMNLRMNTHMRRIMHMADCSLRPQLPPALAPSRPHKIGHKPPCRPSAPRLAHTLSGLRNSRESNQRPISPLSSDQFVEKALKEPTSTLEASLTRQVSSQEASPVSQTTTDPKLLLLRLFQDLVPRRLLPRVTTKPHSSTAAGCEPAWTVTISLHELGINVKGHGSTIIFAEVAAAIQFDLALNTADVVAKLSSWPQTQLSLTDAKNIVQSYWQLSYHPSEALKRVEAKLDSGAFEARTFAGSDQIGEPVTSAVRDSARGIQDLMLAHAVISGHQDLWPMSPGNPFSAHILLDHRRLEKLRHLITAATDYLRTKPGRVVGGKQRGAFFKATQQGREQDSVNLQGGSGAAPHLDLPDLEPWLAALPFPPSTSKMLIVGASLRCLEHAIVLTAMEKHAVYRKAAGPSEEDDGGRGPAFRSAMSGDHPDLLSLFQRLRDTKWLAKKQRAIPKAKDSEEESFQEDLTSPTLDPVLDREGRRTLSNGFNQPAERSSSNNAAVARRFDHYDPDGIARVSASAGAIERSMITAGLVSYQKETSYISVPGSELKIRAEPFGGDLSRTTHRRGILRHLLVLGFSENIAQIGHGTLAPGQPPQLRIGSQEVYIDSPLKAHMPQKQLCKTLGAGPMVVVTGMTDNPQGSRLSARYCTPISTWEAVLLGKDLKTPGEWETPVNGAVQVLVNNWLPVLVRSEVSGVSHEQARDTLFEAREALQRAIDKAASDYVKYSWHSIAFYDLLTSLPNEDSFAAEAVPKAARMYQSTRKNK